LQEKCIALEKQFRKRIGMAVVGLEVPHTHVHLIPLNEMDEMRFQNKVSLSVEFEALAENIKAVAFQIKWYSFRLRGIGENLTFIYTEPRSNEKIYTFNCNFAQKQTQYTLVDQQISQIPIRSTYSTDAIADYINAHFQTEDNKIRFYLLTASNISYDVDKMVALNNRSFRK
jgi:hypothetical protein